jgi:outer membrane protein TolC
MRRLDCISMIYCRLCRLWPSFATVLFTASAVQLSAAGPQASAGSAAAPTTMAQPGLGPVGEVWTLEHALARAMEANPDLLAAKYEVERQEGARLQVTARLLPTVTASAGLNQREQGLVDIPPSQRANPPPPSPDTAVALFG